MKRTLVIVLVIALACAGTAFAKGPGGLTAIGVYGNFGFTGGGGGLGLSLKFGSFPVIGVKYSFTQAGYLGATVDWHLLDAAALVDSLTLYLGVGAFAGINFGSNDFDLGLRFPIGIQIWPIRKVELYLAGIPAVPIFPNLDFAFGAELGFRYHF
jgi:hypothetical protein